MTDATQAALLAEDPSPEILEAKDAMVEAAAASESTAHQRFFQEDGSILVVFSVGGDEAQIRAFDDEAAYSRSEEV